MSNIGSFMYLENTLFCHEFREQTVNCCFNVAIVTVNLMYQLQCKMWQPQHPRPKGSQNLIQVHMCGRQLQQS